MSYVKFNTAQFPELKAGDKVWWNSQASGKWKEKVGVVVAVVPANVYPDDCWDTGSTPTLFKDNGEAFFEFAYVPSALPRDHVSYLVLGPPRTGRKRPQLYFPRLSSIWKWEKVEEKKEVPDAQ